MFLDIPAVIELISKSAAALTSVAGTVAAWVGVKKLFARAVPAPELAAAPPSLKHVTAPAEAAVANFASISTHRPCRTQTPLPQWLAQTTTAVLIGALVLTILSAVPPYRHISFRTLARIFTARPELRPAPEANIVVFVDHSTSMSVTRHDDALDPLLVSGTLSQLARRISDAHILIYGSSRADASIDTENAWQRIGLASIDRDGRWNSIVSIADLLQSRENAANISLIAIFTDATVDDQITSLARVPAYGRSDVVRLMFKRDSVYARPNSEFAIVSQFKGTSLRRTHRVVTDQLRRTQAAKLFHETSTRFAAEKAGCVSLVLTMRDVASVGQSKPAHISKVIFIDANAVNARAG